MTAEDYISLKTEVATQEKTLRFDTFSNRDALDLGNFLVNRVYDQGIDMAVCIRKVNGAILFQHLTEGTSLDNQIWMNRKFNTVCLMEKSSYAAWIDAQIEGSSVAMHGLSDKDYVFCGGGFPIRLKSGEFVGVLIVSNLPHEQDHDFIVKGLEQWFSKN